MSPQQTLRAAQVGTGMDVPARARPRVPMPDGYLGLASKWVLLVIRFEAWTP